MEVPGASQYEELLPIFYAIDELLLSRLENPRGSTSSRKASISPRKIRIANAVSYHVCRRRPVQLSDDEAAAAAAMSMLDEAYLFRRLATIAVEDVCFGDVVATGTGGVGQGAMAKVGR
jgi:hypothetical protein